MKSNKRKHDNSSDEQKRVFLHHPGSNQWIPITSLVNHVLVICDGAGTSRNPEVYESLIEKGYILKKVQAGKRSFEYPDGWGSPGYVSTVPGTLGEFGREVGYSIADNDIPSAIICGSRGGQVVISPIIEKYWRGPIVCINAGILTSNVPITCESFFVFITMGHDYFGTSEIGYVEEKFQKIAQKESKCVILHDPHSGHMPNEDTLKNLMPTALQIATNQTLELSNYTFPSQIQVYSLISGQKLQHHN